MRSRLVVWRREAAVRVQQVSGNVGEEGMR